MDNIDVTIFYKDNFPEEYMISNKEAVDLIKLLKKGVKEFTIKRDNYKTEDLSIIEFSDVDYEGKMQSVGIQFNV